MKDLGEMVLDNLATSRFDFNSFIMSKVNGKNNVLWEVAKLEDLRTHFKEVIS